MLPGFSIGFQWALADLYTGRVVAISDGDTLTVLDADKVQHKVRLSGIDAPEKRQPFGSVSWQHLAGLVFDRDVAVEYHKVDRYGRQLGKVWLADEDANLAQVRAGLAWHYKRYEREQPFEDRPTYSKAEVTAREHDGVCGATRPQRRRATSGGVDSALLR